LIIEDSCGIGWQEDRRHLASKHDNIGLSFHGTSYILLEIALAVLSKVESCGLVFKRFATLVRVWWTVVGIIGVVRNIRSDIPCGAWLGRR
jgi:hypothetical protein